MSSVESAAPLPAGADVHWILPNVSESIVDSLSRAICVSRLMARILVLRGLGDPAAAHAFLNMSAHRLSDPMLLQDMEAAVTRIIEALKKRERILIYGDYDVDGVCSLVILYKAIELLGGRVSYCVPHRLEGYGMREEVIARAAKKGIALVISVDTGIRAHDVVRQASRLDLDIIVTDHHLPDAELPSALAVLNPNRADCAYPNKQLCGAGLAFQLVRGLLIRSKLSRARKQQLLESFLKPAAIATIADVVSLAGENRILVARGLSGMKNVSNPGLAALLATAGIEPGEAPSAQDVAFRIAPRVNAAGRMATAKHAVELMLTGDAGRAVELARKLDHLNADRQKTEREIVEFILGSSEAVDNGKSGLVFYAADWHPGVLGIVASRLVEHFYRPVFVLTDASRRPGFIAGSGRSIPAFHLVEALESISDLFIQFGGHQQAAGVTLSSDRLEEFRCRFAALAAKRITGEMLHKCVSVDAEVCFEELTDETAREVLSLGPFGHDNPTPLLVSRRVTAGRVKPLRGGKHFRVQLSQSDRVFWCNAWNFRDRMDLLEPGALLDVLFHIEEDSFSRRHGSSPGV
ncbi:MAG: single-stranded-DNA-specific exonuclease RecJ [Bryobacteraceae bacterium]